jgi:hypothetical protein
MIAPSFESPERRPPAHLLRNKKRKLSVAMEILVSWEEIEESAGF